MKKFYLFLFNYGVLLLLEFIYGILTFDNFSRSTIINIILFMIPISLIITIITSLFNEKVNKIITYVIYGILGIWYNIYFVFEKIFDSFFSLSVFKLSDQGLKFAGNGISGIFKNIYGVLLLFLPLILVIILKNKLSFKKMKLKEIPFYLVAIILFFFAFVFNIEKQKGKHNSKNKENKILWAYNLGTKNHPIPIPSPELPSPRKKTLNIWNNINKWQYATHFFS